jgi:predicted aminopeptidase
LDNAAPISLRARVLYLVLGISIGLCLGFILVGCCTYHGKFISKREACRMREMGMDVYCPGGK